MSEALSHLLRHWMKQSENGKGIRFSAEQMDILNAIGVGELIASKAAESIRKQAEDRRTQAAQHEPPQATDDRRTSGQKAAARARAMTGLRPKV